MNATNNICSCISQQKEKNRKKGVTGKSVPINNSNELFPFPNIFPPCPFPLNVHQVNNPAEKKYVTLLRRRCSVGNSPQQQLFKTIYRKFYNELFCGNSSRQGQTNFRFPPVFREFIRNISGS